MDSTYQKRLAAYVCAHCDVFYARLPWQGMVKLYKGSIFVITETQFAIQCQVTYHAVTTKLHGTSTADATTMRYFQRGPFSCLLPAPYAAHVDLAVAKHWPFMPVVFAVSVNTIQLNVVLRELNKCALLGCCI